MSCYNCGNNSVPTLTSRLDKRITILRPRGPDDPPPDRDEYGQPIDSPVEVCTVWAAIEPLRGQEFFAAMTEGANVTTRIRVRYRDGIDRTMIVRYKSAEFEIMYTINPNFSNTELQLMCKERQ